VRGPPAGTWSTAVAAGIALLALLAQLPILGRGVVPLDEGQLVAIAERLRQGEVLYRDVYTGIFPGIYYLTALLFGVFGEDVLVTRWAAAAVNAASAALLYLLGVQAMRPAWALLAPALLVALVPFAYPALTMFNYSSLALACALGALLLCLRYLASGQARVGVCAGLALGACGLVKQNFGALAAAALVVALLACRSGTPLARRSRLAGLLPLALGALAPALAVAAALHLAGALPAFLHDTLLAIGASQLEAYDDPLPPIFGAHPADDARFVFAYTPSSLYGYLLLGEPLFGVALSPGLRSAAIRLAYGGSLAVLLAGLALPWLDRAEPQRRRAARAIVAFAALLFLGLFPSAIWSHLAYVLPPVLLLSALLAERLAAAASRAPALARAWGAGCAAFALAALVLGARISLDLRRWHPEPLGSPRASLHVSRDQRALLGGALRFLARCAAPEEPVFVAPDMPLVYFLAARRNPTPYDLLIPGAIDAGEVVEQLAATHTRCVVYNPKMYLQFAAFEELFPEVAAQLASEYRRAAVIRSGSGEWWGLVRERKRGS
jgi:hypothetical protein